MNTEQLLDKWLKIWLPSLGVLGVGAAAYLLLNWSALSFPRKLLLASLAMIVAHIFEEERFPGGFGYLYNVVRSDSDVPDRYPMNPFIAMTVDVGVTLLLFVPALAFPNLYWFGVAAMFLAVLEVFAHSSSAVHQLRNTNMGPYNPGLATAILWGVIGVVYIWTVFSQGLVHGLEWLWAVLYFAGVIFVGLVLPEKGLSSRTARGGFDPDHFLGYYEKYTSLEEALGNSHEQ
ncbi:HXXEE domain-containing protein [Haloferax sp. ATB1]|uniref:HXXEE domain-containing protein n=1 Tax=Haloferax sp. ATB1 TaxID=1508454 RepID=UPI0006942BD4|nr:HXXEE domain-containing protein [Haloferax sp. ATB1]